MSQPASGIPSGAERAAEVDRAHHQVAPAQPAGLEPKGGPSPASSVSISDDARQFAALKGYVRNLLEQQGVELKGEYWDELTVEGAQTAIAEGGEWSAEAVADRIIGFVAEISGGDPEQKERLQKAVQQGFDEARQVFGGWLPDVSERTYELVMERFDEAFKASDESAEAPAAS
jgi:hypothetical protein